MAFLDALGVETAEVYVPTALHTNRFSADGDFFTPPGSAPVAWLQVVDIVVMRGLGDSIKGPLGVIAGQLEELAWGGWVGGKFGSGGI